MSRSTAKNIEKLSAEIFEHTATLQLPDKVRVYQFIETLHDAMFPHSAECISPSQQQLIERLLSTEQLLDHILRCSAPAETVRREKLDNFFDHLTAVFLTLRTDAEAHFETDPAAVSLEEIYTTYPGFKAISFFRCANILHKLGIPTIPRIITEYAHQLTGIDIHPGATIGSHFAIDHGTGVVIGETTTIGNHVTLYQGVTLGSISVSKESRDSKRHPTIEDHVKIYANATILGGKTVIGHHSIIGGNSWVTHSVEPNSKIYRKMPA